MRDLPLLFITNLDLPETAFYEEPLEKPAVYDSEEETFITLKAQQDERFATTLHNQLWCSWDSFNEEAFEEPAVDGTEEEKF